jgi:phage nucleotide-binding protein
VECFKDCPRKYKLRYVDGMEGPPDDDPANALALGRALHTGIEKGVGAAVAEYLGAYPIATDGHFDEIAKLERLIPQAAAMLPPGEFEVEVRTEGFIGFLDFLTTENGVDHDLYDFKYSNNAARYRESGQLSVYKHFWEMANPGKRIGRMFFLMVPKAKIRRGKNEEAGRFRERLRAELDRLEPYLMPVGHDPGKVADWLLGARRALQAEDWPKRESYFCGWCEFKSYCEKGDMTMLLPKNERRNIGKAGKRTLWLYGAPFSGKTTFANKFPDPLMLNTDGNVAFVDAPYVPIKDGVRVEGRMTRRTLAWQAFKDAIGELEKKDNSFKTVVVDLLEDLYEHCRLFMYQQMGITHESDDSFRAWDKVRTEFLSTLRRLMNLDYENIILISHEDSSKDLTKKGGDKITAIRPNLQEKASNKVAGMVHVVARVVADGDARTLSFKPNEVVFGGGRLPVSKAEIPLDFDEFVKIWDAASRNAASGTEAARGGRRAAGRKPPAGEPDRADEPLGSYRADEAEEAEPLGSYQADEAEEEPAPAPRARRRRGERTGV